MSTYTIPKPSNISKENATQNGGEFKASVCELFQLKSHG